MKLKKNKYNILLIDIGGNGVQYKINDNLEKEFLTINKDKDFVLKEISYLINKNNIHFVSISSPGSCNYKTGWVDGLSGIKNYGNFNFYEEIKNKINNKDVKILINNDANCSLFANLFSFKVKDAIQINIGTGIGGAIAINNNIVFGKHGYAGEFGYSLVDNKNNLSEKISTNALVKKFKGKYNNSKEILNNELNSNLFKEWIKDVSFYLISLQYSFDPEVIFISGGISNNENFINLLNKEIKNIINNKQGYKLIPDIKVSKNKNDGILGANLLLIKYIQKTKENK